MFVIFPHILEEIPESLYEILYTVYALAIEELFINS